MDDKMAEYIEKVHHHMSGPSSTLTDNQNSFLLINLLIKSMEMFITLCLQMI